MKKYLKRLYMLFFHTWMLIRVQSIGKNCFIGRRASINKPEYLILQDNVRIGNDARLSFYDNFNNQKLEPNLVIGQGSYIGNHFSVLCADKVEIEEEVLIASYVMISSENHGIDPEGDTGYGKQSLITQPVRICKGVWIGEKVSILPGVTIGEKSIIGTGSIVTKDIPPYSIAIGMPAKVIKKYDFVDHRWKRIEEEY